LDNNIQTILYQDVSVLAKDMMQSDVKLMQKDQYLKEGGYLSINHVE